MNLNYPAALTAFGISGNAYVLEGQVKEAKDQLMNEMMQMNGDVREVKKEIKALQPANMRWNCMTFLWPRSC